jgi:hypothetical protein
MASSSPSSTSDEEKDHAEFMSNFSPSLVQRIMLTDPIDFPKLTTSGLPHESKSTNFTSFAKERGFIPSRPAVATAATTSGTGSRDDGGGIADIETAASNLSISSSASAMTVEEQISQAMHKAYNNVILEQMRGGTGHDEADDDTIEAKDKTNDSINYQPLQSIILETHSNLRALVPNRKDLHNHLSDQDVMQQQQNQPTGALKNFTTVLNHLNKIARVLFHLESEYRHETTKDWIRIASSSSVTAAAAASASASTELGGENDCDVHDKDFTITIQIQSPHDENVDGDDHHRDESGNSNNPPYYEQTMDLATFALASSAYLHSKAEICQTDVADFQLGHILAPKIHALGKKYLLHRFEQQFGAVAAVAVEEEEDKLFSIAPNTKTWMEEIIQNSSYTIEELNSSDEKRGSALLQTGWIDGILFRSPRSANVDETQASSPPFMIPEVLSLDISSIQQIRMTTKMSVVGSVLAVHATAVAGVSGALLKTDPLEHSLEQCRLALGQAMGNRKVGSREIYESNIGNAVLKLAQVLNPSLPPSAEETIMSRTRATLRGEDPVIKLLDNRMREIFRQMMVCNPQTLEQVPTMLRTGRALSIHNNSGSSSSNQNVTTYGSVFTKAAKKEFTSKGFALYANELAEASLLASRIINLSMSVYGSTVLEKLFFLTSARVQE